MLLAAGAGVPPALHAAPSHGMFLDAERAVDQRRLDDARALMRGLADHPLLPYLELAIARQQLAVMDGDALAALLARHADVPGSAALRQDWLRQLAGAGRYREVLARFHDDGHLASACLAAEAAWRTGLTGEAWSRMSRLWRTGDSLPRECDPVIAAWRDAGQLTEALAWDRFELAMDAGNVRLARYLAREMPPSTSRTLAGSWLQLRTDPSALPAFAGAIDADARRRHVVVNVFARAASRSPEQGRALWQALSALDLPPELKAELREQLGEVLARERAPDALDWLHDARGADALRARAVEAIRTGRMDEVAAAVAAMPAEHAEMERWRYWQARAMAARDPAGARERLAALAGERSFYGFLAADRLRSSYDFGDAPITVSEADMQRIARLPAALRARAWLDLDRTEEARREWNVLLAGADRDATLGAARLAHAWGWHEAAIRAAASARHWSDLELRFPLAHRDAVQRAAERSGVEPSRIYAVVRQESAFMLDVRSRAGALGLMQVMPATARQVARTEKLPRPGRTTLLEPESNLLIGSLYLELLERRYTGHAVLASAAYNAGPARVRQWQPRDAPVASEVWIETIPFTETRRYVRAVLAYQVIYAHRLGVPPVRLQQLMPDVPPT